MNYVEKQGNCASLRCRKNEMNEKRENNKMRKECAFGCFGKFQPKISMRLILAAAFITAILSLTTILSSSVWADSGYVPTPHGVQGTVYDAETLDEITAPVKFRVTDESAGEIIEGRTGRGTPEFPGRYSVSLNGRDGNSVLVEVWNDYHASQLRLVLEGSMRNVNLLLNMTPPKPGPAPGPSTPSRGGATRSDRQQRIASIEGQIKSSTIEQPRVITGIISEGPVTLKNKDTGQEINADWEEVPPEGHSLVINAGENDTLELVVGKKAYPLMITGHVTDVKSELEKDIHLLRRLLSKSGVLKLDLTFVSVLLCSAAVLFLVIIRALRVSRESKSSRNLQSSRHSGPSSGFYASSVGRKRKNE